MSYKGLLNQYTLNDLDELSVSGVVDFTNATLIGFPKVDDITIRLNAAGEIEVKNGSITIAKVTGTDLWTRLLADEASISNLQVRMITTEDNVLTLQNKTQYQTAASNVTTFIGTINVPTLLLNGEDVGTDLAFLFEEFRLVELRTRFQSSNTSTSFTTFTGSVTATNLYYKAINVEDQFDSVFGLIGDLEDKTQYMSVDQPTTTTHFASGVSAGTNPIKGGQISCSSLITTALTGYLYGNGIATVSASPSIPQAAVTSLSTDLSALQTKTQFQSTKIVDSETTFSGIVNAQGLFINGVNVSNRISLLEAKTVNQSSFGPTTTFSGFLVCNAILQPLNDNLTLGRTDSGIVKLQFGTAGFHYVDVGPGMLKNKKLVLYNTEDNEHRFYGFGLNGGTLRYQVDYPTSNHIFYCGTSSTTSSEILRVGGTGIQASVPVTFNSGVKQSVTSVISSPFSVLNTHSFLAVDTSASGKTLNLPSASSAGLGTTIVVKDVSGKAQSNIVTIVPSGSDKIDGQSTFGLNSNYASLTLVATSSTAWSVI